LDRLTGDCHRRRFGDVIGVRPFGEAGAVGTAGDHDEARCDHAKKKVAKSCRVHRKLSELDEMVLAGVSNSLRMPR
jgi:hypothetical protein